MDTGKSVQAVVIDFDQPHTSNNLADISQAVIDALWPDYTIGMKMNADIVYTGETITAMTFGSIGDSISESKSDSENNKCF